MATATAAHIRFESFDPEKEEWTYYIQRFEVELTLHGLNTASKAEEKRNQFLAKVGSISFKILVDHFKPNSVVSKSYDELKAVLDKHYKRQTYVLSERVAFSMRCRQENESVTQFLSVLRGLAGSCEFGENLNERLRDQLVIGINQPAWQQEIILKYTTNAAKLSEVETYAIQLEQASIHGRKLSEMTLFKHPESATAFRVKQVESRSFPKPSTSKDENRVVLRLDIEKHCIFCGYDVHKNTATCAARDKTCAACSKRGHFARACISSGRAKLINKQRSGGVRHVRVQDRDRRQSNESSDEEHFSADSNISAIRAVRGKKAFLDVKLNELDVAMLYDPGAEQSVAGRSIWEKLGKPKLKPTLDLVVYSHLPIDRLGTAHVRVAAFGTIQTLPLTFVNSNDVPLFGFDWCLAFGLPLPPGARVCSVKGGEREEWLGPSGHTEHPEQLQLERLLSQYGGLFENRIGTIRGPSARIHISEDVRPKAFRARPVPIALREQVNAEIERLVNEGVLELVDTTITSISWASPIVVVVKSNGAVRLCGDFNVTINPYVQVDDYPLPTFEEITAKLCGGRKFSKIDLKDAYLQLQVHPDSRKYLVVATHKGYYAYKKLPFGVSFAPALFQRTMDQLLSGIEGVVCYLDDILVTAPTPELHLQRLKQVLERLEAVGIKTERRKCAWFQSSITYLGHVIDRFGIHPIADKIEAIQGMPAPQNTTELRSFLGSITYYGRFIPNLHAECALLHRLLRKNVRWDWTEEDNKVFLRLKTILCSNDTLVHYDPKLPIYVCTDASNRGAGAVLSHKFTDGTLRPIAYASRTWTDTEGRYSTIDKEALAIIFAVSKFNSSLYGRHFFLVTDHKPLQYIFSENRTTPKIASNRLLRWATILNSYNYTIQYQCGKENAPADALSRLPIAMTSRSAEEEAGEPKRSQLLHLRLHHLCVTRKTLKSGTSADPVLRKVCDYTNGRWPEKKHLAAELIPYFEKREELSVEEGILLWKGRICVPAGLQSEILKMLHDGHPGVSVMQSLARLHVYWPRIDTAIEDFVRKCYPCQRAKRNEQYLPLFPWAPPAEAWSRVHIDFAGPFQNKWWLIVVDAYSRWLEVVPMSTTTSERTITALMEVFSRVGSHILGSHPTIRSQTG
ncbi:uncharacterized protein K02A2.6-like [Photinus pyralis]|uniref:uncharacterized protein K02A2.6-like n=1 Tax=Photinus pyralis TaxID=7054 RepID=UPI0012676524|nr:uncharacterized protein K02A2.6-like [Photinus pyralis]